MSGNENVYQNSAAPMATSAEQTIAMYSARTTVNVPSEYIVTRAKMNKGVAHVTSKSTKCPLRDELPHLKNLLRTTVTPC